jgi:HlyD family secretion protein
MSGAGDVGHEAGERRHPAQGMRQDVDQSLGDVKERGRTARHAETFGPQGAALIQELRRIQRAFHQEQHWSGATPQPQRAPHEHGRTAAPHVQHRARMARQGMFSRALKACLQGFGFADRPPIERRPPVAHAWPQTAHPPRPAQSGEQAAQPQHAIPHATQHATNVRPLTGARPRRRRNDDAIPPPQGLMARREPMMNVEDLPPISRGGRADPAAQGVPPAHVTAKAGPRRDREALPLRRQDHAQMEDTRACSDSAPQDGALPPPRVDEHRRLDFAGAVPAQTKAAIDRVVATCIGHARSSVAFLLGPGEALADDADGAELVTRVRRSFERELRTGLRVLVLGVVLIGGWATLVPLSSAVVAAGSLVVQSNVKKVQHPTGGIVAQIAAHDGMHVNAGDLLVRLDATQARANLEMIAKQLDEVRIRIARLIAERDGLDKPTMPPELAKRSADAEAAARFASETSLFQARATARKNQKELLQSRIAQLGQQIDGLQAQIKSNASQVDLITSELKGVQTLFAKGLAPITRVDSLQRELARLQGERGQFQSSIAETNSKIGEAKLQIIRVDQDFRADVIKDLREAEGKEAELAERQVAAQDVLNRVDIRAPTAGIVHELKVHTVGGVISAGEVVMEIVPDADDLQVEARLSPRDIDQVRVGQSTLVRFSAFSQRTTPQLGGVVSYVSADITQDQHDNTSYYTVRITLPAEEHHRLAGLQLVSGMPAEIFVQTGSRTMMSYLLKPITDQLRRAFIER